MINRLCFQYQPRSKTQVDNERKNSTSINNQMQPKPIVVKFLKYRATDKQRTLDRHIEDKMKDHMGLPNT